MRDVSISTALFLSLSVLRIDGPEARACHAMAYHEALGQVVLFGGASACGTRVLDERRLWGWDGEHWNVLADGGPSPREDALLAYDARRKSLVLYGGRNGATVHADTWEWDGTTWRQIAAESSAGPVEHAAMAFDSARGRVVLFGGGFRSPASTSGASWEWDGESWVAGAEPGPPARVGLALTRSVADGRAVLFGGFDPDGGPFRDLWRLEDGRWRALASDAPIVTEGHTVAGTRDDLVLVGLAPDGPSSAGRFLSLRFVEGKWTEIAGAAPPWRVGGAMAYDQRRDTVVLFGGHDPGAHRSLADLWELGADGWKAIDSVRAR